MTDMITPSGKSKAVPMSCFSLGFKRAKFFAGVIRNNVMITVACTLWKHVFCVSKKTIVRGKTVYKRRCATSRDVRFLYADTCSRRVTDCSSEEQKKSEHGVQCAPF